MMDDDDNNTSARRHHMYKYADQAQKILLNDNYNSDGGKTYKHLVIVDIADMIPDNDEEDKTTVLKDILQKENTQVDLVKGFGKVLVKCFND